MMLYSIQNSYGKVYGIHGLPEVGMDIEQWETALRGELDGNILDLNGVRASSLSGDPTTGEKIPRVVVEVQPSFDNVNVERVHIAVAMIALNPPI